MCVRCNGDRLVVFRLVSLVDLFTVKSNLISIFS